MNLCIWQMLLSKAFYTACISMTLSSLVFRSSVWVTEMPLPSSLTCRSRGRPLPAIVRLLRGLLLRSPLLDENLQACAAAGWSLHQTAQERLPQPGDLPALWLRQRTCLQGMERRHVLLQVQAARVPEDLRQEAPAKQAAPWGPCVPLGEEWTRSPFSRTYSAVINRERVRYRWMCARTGWVWDGNELIWWDAQP